MLRFFNFEQWQFQYNKPMAPVILTVVLGEIEEERSSQIFDQPYYFKHNDVYDVLVKHGPRGMV